MDLKKIIDQHRFLIIGLIAFCALYLVLYRQMHTAPLEAPKTAEKVQADTFIPAGFVLVPIQLENNEAVSGLVDQFAVVDVYAVNPTSQLNELVAEKVKMMRAPLDPNQFAVLLQDEKARELLKLNGRFSVVLQNRHVIGAVTEVQQTLNSAGRQRLPTPASPREQLLGSASEPRAVTPPLASTKMTFDAQRAKPSQVMKVKVEYARSAL